MVWCWSTNFQSLISQAPTELSNLLGLWMRERWNSLEASLKYLRQLSHPLRSGWLSARLRWFQCDGVCSHYWLLPLFGTDYWRDPNGFAMLSHNTLAGLPCTLCGSASSRSSHLWVLTEFGTLYFFVLQFDFSSLPESCGTCPLILCCFPSLAWASVGEQRCRPYQ